jgi:hypothetical protein
MFFNLDGLRRDFEMCILCSHVNKASWTCMCKQLLLTAPPWHCSIVILQSALCLMNFELADSIFELELGRIANILQSLPANFLDIPSTPRPNHHLHCSTLAVPGPRAGAQIGDCITGSSPALPLRASPGLLGPNTRCWAGFAMQSLL